MLLAIRVYAFIFFKKIMNVEAEVNFSLTKYGKGARHIFNFGHGILPDISIEQAKEFVRAVKEESIKYHR